MERQSKQTGVAFFRIEHSIVGLWVEFPYGGPAPVPLTATYYKKRSFNTILSFLCAVLTSGVPQKASLVVIPSKLRVKFITMGVGTTD